MLLFPRLHCKRAFPRCYSGDAAWKPMCQNQNSSLSGTVIGAEIGKTQHALCCRLIKGVAHGLLLWATSSTLYVGLTYCLGVKKKDPLHGLLTQQTACTEHWTMFWCWIAFMESLLSLRSLQPRQNWVFYTGCGLDSWQSRQWVTASGEKSG